MTTNPMSIALRRNFDVRRCVDNWLNFITDWIAERCQIEQDAGHAGARDVFATLFKLEFKDLISASKTGVN